MRLPATAVTAGLTAVLSATLLLTACGKESDRAADRTTPSADTTATDGTATDGTATDAPTAPAGTAAYPSFAPADYTYHLEVLCYCPQVGTVEVVVRDGSVAEATSLDGPTAGTPAPEFARLTINDIIERANDPQVAKARVRWPDGQDHPNSVMLDGIAQAVDDEVTYTIKNVRIP